MEELKCSTDNRQPRDIIDRAKLIRQDFDTLPLLDGDLDTEGTYHLIRLYGKRVNDELAAITVAHNRRAT